MKKKIILFYENINLNNTMLITIYTLSYINNCNFILPTLIYVGFMLINCIFNKINIRLIVLIKFKNYYNKNISFIRENFLIDFYIKKILAFFLNLVCFEISQIYSLNYCDKIILKFLYYEFISKIIMTSYDNDFTDIINIFMYIYINLFIISSCYLTILIL